MSEAAGSSGRLDSDGKRAIAYFLIPPLLAAVMLFIGAGRLNWTLGWVFSIVYLLAFAGLDVALVRSNPDLLNKRGRPRQALDKAQGWDNILLQLYTLDLLIQPLVAGLDCRNQWSAPPDRWVYVVGNLINIAGVALLAWSMVANRFFEGTVRIQTERGHQVIAAGPYRYVRHPGYVGVILSFIALPIALGTWTAFIPGLIGVAIYVIRTALEDRMLQAELPGYSDYAQQTRYRLLPGVW